MNDTGMAEAQAERLRGRRLLVVEEECFIAAEMAHALGSLGAIVVGPTATVDGARKLIESAEALDGAFLDINLRGQAVYPIADLLRSRALPFVFATGYEPSRIPDDYADVPRCEKPVSASAVADALAALIEG